MAVLGDPEPEDCKEAGLGKAGFEMVLPSGGVWKVDCNLDLSGQFQSFWEPLSGIQITLD